MNNEFNIQFICDGNLHKGVVLIYGDEVGLGFPEQRISDSRALFSLEGASLTKSFKQRYMYTYKYYYGGFSKNATKEDIKDNLNRYCNATEITFGNIEIQSKNYKIFN